MIAKIKNHFVWQHYLKMWSQNERDVFYTTQSGKISNDSVKGLAMERHFYKCQSLSPTQLDIIRLTSSNAIQILKNIIWKFLETTSKSSDVNNYCKCFKSKTPRQRKF